METQTKGGLEGNVSVPNNSWKTLDELELFTQSVNTSVFPNVSNTSGTSHKILLILTEPPVIRKIVIAFLGILLNLMCVMALFQVKDKWTCHFRIMLSLMFADMLIAVSVMTYIFAYAYTHYFIEEENLHYIPVIRCFFLMGMNANLLNVVCMAIDHYVVIMYPWRSPVSAKRSHIIVTTVWVIAAITAISNFFTPVLNYTTLPIGLVCLIVMVCVYVSIYRTAKNSGKQVAVRTTGGRISFINQKNLKALVTTSMILGTFILSWVPVGCLNLMMQFRVIRDHDVWLSDIFTCLFLLNTVCDPIIYAVRIRRVRKGFLILLSKIASKCWKHKFTDPQSCLNYRQYD